MSADWTFLPGRLIVARAATGWHTVARLPSGHLITLVGEDRESLQEAFGAIVPGVASRHTACSPVIVAAQYLAAPTEAPLPKERLARHEQWPLAHWFNSQGREQLQPQFWGDDDE